MNDIVNAYIYVGDFHYVHGSIKKASKHYWEAYFLSLRDGRVRSLCRQIIIRVLILMIELESPFDGSAGKLPYSTDEERQCAEGLRLFKERHFRDAAVIVCFPFSLSFFGQTYPIPWLLLSWNWSLKCHGRVSFIMLLYICSFWE